MDPAPVDGPAPSSTWTAQTGVLNTNWNIETQTTKQRQEVAGSKEVGVVLREVRE